MGNYRDLVSSILINAPSTAYRNVAGAGTFAKGARALLGRNWYQAQKARATSPRGAVADRDLALTRRRAPIPDLQVGEGGGKTAFDPVAAMAGYARRPEWGYRLI